MPQVVTIIHDMDDPRLEILTVEVLDFIADAPGSTIRRHPARATSRGALCEPCSEAQSGLPRRDDRGAHRRPACDSSGPWIVDRRKEFVLPIVLTS